LDWTPETWVFCPQLGGSVEADVTILKLAPFTLG
jgi:hypothetical protein